MKLLLINDTSEWYHFGCAGTSFALQEKIDEIIYDNKFLEKLLYISTKKLSCPRLTPVLSLNALSNKAKNNFNHVKQFVNELSLSHSFEQLSITELLNRPNFKL